MSTPPKQADSNGCGVFGQILVAALAIAVSVATYGVLTAPATSLSGAGILAGGGLASVAAGGVAGAAGSIASQGFANGIGAQEGFSWKGVGIAALGGAVGGALAPGGIFEKGAFGAIGSGVVASVLRAVASSALTQGIGVATGLQDKFSWAGVAAAGVAGGVGFASRSVLGAKSLTEDNTLSNHFANLGASTASLIASAATRSAIEGTSFGDNIRAGLPDVIGLAINNVVESGLSLHVKEVEDNPVASSGGFRSTGLEYEAAIKIPPLFQKPALTAKFGGSRNSQFDYSVNFGPDWLQDGVDWVAGALEGAEEVIDGWIGHAEQVWDGVSEKAIVVRANLVDYASRKIDQAVREATSTIGRMSLNLAGNAVIPGLGTAVSAGVRKADAQAIGRGEMRGVIGTANSALQGMKFLADLASPNPFVASQTALGFVQGITALARDPGQVVRAVSAENNRIAGLSGSQRLEEQAYLATRVVTELGLLAVGGEISSMSRLGGSKGLGIREFGGAYSTNGELVQSIATRADNWGIRKGMGNGPIVGTAKHGYAEALLNRNQRMFGDRGLIAEARYVGGAPWQPGMTTTGSIRLDVVEGALVNPTHVWDYKFGQATLSPSRTTQLQNGIPNGAKVPILMVKP